MLFRFVVKHLNFLKHVPVLPFFFDGCLQFRTFLFSRQVFHTMEEIENELSGWPQVEVCLHRYGGIQFNYQHKELGHIHGNGLVDILLNKKLKQECLVAGLADEHHVFKRSGWVSFYITSPADKKKVIRLLEIAYRFRAAKLMACSLILTSKQEISLAELPE